MPSARPHLLRFQVDGTWNVPTTLTFCRYLSCPLFLHPWIPFLVAVGGQAEAGESNWGMAHCPARKAGLVWVVPVVVVPVVEAVVGPGSCFLSHPANCPEFLSPDWSVAETRELAEFD